MNEIVNTYIRTNNIDSFQKLRLLLFLHQHPHVKATSQEFANRLHLGDTLLIENIITDLHQAGLIDQVDNRYKLPDKPEVRSQLQHLARAFEHPLTRQELLKQVKLNPPLRSYRETPMQSYSRLN